MTTSGKLSIFAAILAVVAVAGGAALASGGALDEQDETVHSGDAAEDAAEGPDEAITGDALDRASNAALTYLGEGRVTGTEVGDEDSYYEVEVTLDDGSQVDVQLDEAFDVVGTD